MADEVKLTKEELAQVKQAIQEIAQIRGVKVSEVKMTKNSIAALAKDIADGMYKKDKNFQGNVVQLLTEALKDQKRKKSFWDQIKSGGSESIDWNLDRRIKGINAALSGSFKYGTMEILQSFKIGRGLIGHPLIQFAAASAKLTAAMIDFNNRANVLADKLAGGALTYSTNARDSKYRRRYERKAAAIIYGQNEEDYTNFIMGSFGSQTKEAYNKDPRFSMAYNQGRAIMQRFGADPNQMNELMKQQNTINRSTISMEKFNYKLIKAFEGLDKFSSQSLIQAYTDLNKTLLANNVQGLASIDWLKKFQDQLNNGTLTIQNFTQGLTTRRGAETSTLAGVGAMLAERGLGGKELQEAYARGDMIAVAGAVRRGGVRMQKDIEKIAPEISKQLGTSDWREALALQSGTPWGQLTGDLKNLEVQKILTSGGSLAAQITGKEIKLSDEAKKDKDGDIITEEQEFKNANKELIKATVENTGMVKNLTNALGLLGSKIVADFEQDKTGTLTKIGLYSNPITAPFKISKAIIELGNPNH